MKKPTHEEVSAIDLTELHGFIRNGRTADYFNAEPGKEHYKLLAWFSAQFNKAKLCEIGTLDGCGALALGYNPKNSITTFDVRFYDDVCDFPKNVKSKLVDEDDAYLEEVIKCPVIFYDTMHDGTLERKFVEDMISRGWKGVVIFDDIYLNEPMKNFWNELAVRKEDWTDLGHWSGTGVAFFE